MKTMIAQVKIFSSARKTGKRFDYICPANVPVTKGTIVSVPFGKSNKSVFGVVESAFEKEPEMKLKEIAKVFPEEVRMTDEMISVCDFMCKTYFCNFGDAAKCMISSPMLTGKEKTVKFVSLCSGTDPHKCLENFKGKNKEEYQKLIEYIGLAENVRSDALNDLFSNAAKNVAFLEKKGFLTVTKLAEERFPYDFSGEMSKKDKLNKSQQSAFRKISEIYDTSLPAAVLLHGVTGSGKTRVILEMCEKVISQGKSVIFLVPEIALTGQSAKLLISRFGKKVAIIHSALSQGEKRDALLAIKAGEKKIVLGTRSAIFAPLSDLGLIVIDEEQDQSYKSDTGVKFHARDIARFRCAKNGAMLLLASATPDVETYYKALTGKYSLVTMKDRFGGNTLPLVEIADVRNDLRNDPTRLIGKKLDCEIRKNLKDKRQTILLMNRRGYKRFVSCTDCGSVIKCPNCSVSLTLHNGREKKLSCHYCGYIIPLPNECPECHKNHLMTHGAGIQQLEEELKNFYPEAKVLRMDSDSANEKLVHDKIIDDFSKGNADILIGTQMVAKGHNFPLVTLVGIVMADSSLYLSDYRAYEHTFSLLTQVIGRAGRSEYEGRALIQTLNPRHNVFSLSSEQNYEKFYEGEIVLRKNFLFPPFCDIAVFTLSDENEKRLEEKTNQFALNLEKLLKNDFSDVKFVVYGPFEATVYKIRNVYRKRFIIKYKNTPRSRLLFESQLDFGDSITDSRTKISLDLNPSLI